MLTDEMETVKGEYVQNFKLNFFVSQVKAGHSL